MGETAVVGECSSSWIMLDVHMQHCASYNHYVIVLDLNLHLLKLNITISPKRRDMNKRKRRR